MNKYTVLSLICISFIIGIGFGYYLTPEYSVMKNERASAMALGNADRYLDLRYVNGMIGHHLSAIFLSKQALAQSKRPEIQELSKGIITADEKDIKRLYAYKKDWYEDVREVTQYTKVNLGTSNDAFDLRFLNALIIHHDEAIAVAHEVLGKSTRNETLTIASEVIRGLTKSREQLVTMRMQWFSI